ncbi:MAG: leucyl aminopeptidase family protein [Pseudomonadales bacterium]|nr:leucyl aminopeptidase family protein [Pseudomonadales bacterium]
MSDLPRGFCNSTDQSTPIILVQTSDVREWLEQQSPSSTEWLRRQKFSGKAGQHAWYEDGASSSVVVAWNGTPAPETLGALPMVLPEGQYHLSTQVHDLILLGWGMGAYQFDRYTDPKRAPAELVLPAEQSSRIGNLVDAISLGRDLINTPAADMAPSNLMAEVQAMAEEFGATCDLTTGDALLDRNCGAIHAVGRAAEDPPSLAELRWGSTDHPHIVIIGKGVTFDSGGLNLKNASGMRTMKKDMGGAATAIALAYAIMAEELPIQLSLIIPAAENAVSGNAFRPGDILNTHAGLTVEIDNTDAEGRLLLCDALSIASKSDPELIVDFATLTGSARSAVGTEIGAMFATSDEVATAIGAAGSDLNDAVWRMPLHQPYKYMIDSKIADLVNSAASPYAGSVTAALFLQHFVGESNWVHFDIMAYNTRNRAAHPEGGEVMGLRAVLSYLEDTYGTAA